MFRHVLITLEAKLFTSRTNKAGINGSLNVSNTDVVVLCGGFGTRLSSLNLGVPKGLISIAGKPFLDLLIGRLVESGFKRFILCTGHMSDKYQTWFKSNRRDEIDLIFSEEITPLGTGGAVENALSKVSSDRFVLVNGDSLCEIHYQDFFERTISREVLATMVVTRNVLDRTGSGHVMFGPDLRATNMNVNMEGHTGYVNAGIYMIDKSYYEVCNFKAPFSLEGDVFPELIRRKKMDVFTTGAELIDIGTPERLEMLKQRYQDRQYG